MNDLLYKYTSAIPPWIILFYFYDKNKNEISYWQALIAALVFSLLSLAFYSVVSNIEKSHNIRARQKKNENNCFDDSPVLRYAAPAAMLTVTLWIISAAIKPLYDAMLEIFNKPIRYTVCAFCTIGISGIVFVLTKNIKRKEIFILIAVFETVLFAFNFIPGTFSFAANKDMRRPLPANVDDKSPPPPIVETPRPSIYWLFMDGMLGFDGMERLFGDKQEEFAAALIDKGFLINRKAEFEVFHGTTRATAALMSPSWYDNTLLPILSSINLDDYNAKQKTIENINPLFARRNNELIRAFSAKGYTVNIISSSGAYLHNDFYETSDNIFYDAKLISGDKQKLFVSYIKFRNLNSLLGDSLASWTIIDTAVMKFADSLYGKAMNVVPVPQIIADKTSVYGDEYDGDFFTSNDDRWFVDALAEVSARRSPQFTIVHDLKAHVGFIRNEDGSLAIIAEGAELDPDNYPPQHRYAAKIVLEYAAIILERDPDAVIVIEADHGLHTDETREYMLERNKSDEDIRVMQNHVMSAVRIPEKWGGLDEPLDPLNISRVLANRYAGKNYTLLENHP
jgi:hypothetical protein